MDQAKFLRRSSLLPRRPSDYPLFLFLLSAIPIIYWFEMWVVLPSLFSNHPVIYWSVFILGHFILHNIVGNLLGIIMFDTSIKGREMPKENTPGVQYCSICETLTPPRSNHCFSCNVCILKRDHHCLFTSCCIGFYNHRYFFLFIFYMLLATVICLPFNVYFLWDLISLTEFSFILAIIFPVVLFLFDFEPESFEERHFYLLLSALSVVGLLFCSVWFYFHMKLILNGTIIHEMRKCINIYNLGQEKNLEMVFGKRWHLTWISPYLKSPLVCDGINFPISEKYKSDYSLIEKHNLLHKKK